MDLSYDGLIAEWRRQQRRELQYHIDQRDFHGRHAERIRAELSKEPNPNPSRQDGEGR